jgi:hypothetical protein
LPEHASCLTSSHLIDIHIALYLERSERLPANLSSGASKS